MTAYNGMKGHTRPYTHANGHTLASVTLDSNGVGAPDGLSDPAGIVASIARDGAGVLTVTFKNRYAKIHALAGVGVGVAGAGVKVVAIVGDGAAAPNLVSIITYAPGGAVAADTTDVTYVILLNMYDSLSDG